MFLDLISLYQKVAISLESLSLKCGLFFNNLFISSFCFHFFLIFKNYMNKETIHTQV